jgi:hypothetical protein
VAHCMELLYIHCTFGPLVIVLQSLMGSVDVALC